MEHFKSLRPVVTVAAVAALLLAGRPAAAGDTPRKPHVQSMESLGSMAKFWSGTSGRTGNFPGKLVCLRCDAGMSREGSQKCEELGHRHALAMEGDAMLHPLLAGTETMARQVNSAELHGKQVSVHGVYYPGTGVILVDRIDPTR